MMSYYSNRMVYDYCLKHGWWYGPEERCPDCQREREEQSNAAQKLSNAAARLREEILHTEVIP